MKLEVRRNRFFSPEMEKLNGKKVPVYKKDGKPSLLPTWVRQAIIPDETGIGGVKGYLVSCRVRDTKKRLETMLANVLAGEWSHEQGRAYVETHFTVSVIRDSLPESTLPVNWASCPAGIRAKWGICSEAIPLNLTQNTHHQCYFAIDKDGKVLGKAEIRHTLEMKFPKMEIVYGYLPPVTLSGEKRGKIANEVLPYRFFKTEKSFVNFAKWFVKGCANAKALIAELRDNTPSE